MSKKTDGHFAFSFAPKTFGQKLVCRSFLTHDVLLVLGAAGSGKTFISLALGLQEVNQGRKKKVVYCRPVVECGRSMGFLPGSLEEKYEPYLAPLKGILPKMAYKLPEGVVECLPISFLRGVTLEDCVVVVDEAQNVAYSELKMLLTRLGQNSKILLVGDPDQADIQPTQDKFYCDLDAIADKLDGVPGVAIIDLPPETAFRHPLVAEFAKRL